jgi:hypothetical protein
MHNCLISGGFNMRLSGGKLTGMTVLFLCAANAFAVTTNIKNFAELVSAVENGNDVKAIIHYDKCTSKQRVANFVEYTGSSGRLNFDRFSHYKVTVGNEVKETVATSTTMSIEHPNGVMSNDYARLRIYADTTADFHVTYNDPLTNKSTFTMDLACSFSANPEQSAIVLFASN